MRRWPVILFDEDDAGNDKENGQPKNLSAIVYMGVQSTNYHEPMAAGVSRVEAWWVYASYADPHGPSRGR